MKSEEIRLVSASHNKTPYTIRRDYGNDSNLIREVICRDGKQLEYAVYVSDENLKQCLADLKKDAEEHKLKSRGDLGKLVTSWRLSRSLQDKGGRIFYLEVRSREDGKLELDPRYSGPIEQYQRVNNKPPIVPGSKPVQTPAAKKPVAKPLAETPADAVSLDELGIDPNSLGHRKPIK